MATPPDREPEARDAALPSASYTAEALAACEKALVTVVSRVGSWGPRLVLFGGLAPRYIVDEVPEGVAPHTGTTDLDLVIGLAVLGEEEAVYTKLQQELRNAGFEPSRESYAWERWVDGVQVVMEFFCPVAPDGEPGRIRRNPGGEAGSTVSAIQLKGADLAGRDCRLRPIECEVLDHGGRRSVEVQVVNLLPFIMLKAFALESRDKEKDAYDLVWTLSAYGRGPAHVAEVAAESPIAREGLVHEAMAILADRFSDLDRQGPSNYARFFLGARDEPDARDRHRRFALATAQRFLRRWEEGLA
jgi:hypothetical protein